MSDGYTCSGCAHFYSECQCHVRPRVEKKPEITLLRTVDDLRSRLEKAIEELKLRCYCDEVPDECETCQVVKEVSCVSKKG